MIVCVVRRRQKESPSVEEPGEVRHNLMSDQPLPPPPTPTQWSHLYTDNSSYYDGNTYEVPHHHPGKTPAPSLRYGFSGHPPSLASTQYTHHVGQPVYYHD